MDFSTSVLGCSEEILGFVQRRMFSVSEVRSKNFFKIIQVL